LRDAGSLRRRFEEVYGEVLEAAREGEQRCFGCMRWGGYAVLVVVDAALDSIGLNYFKIVVPRVKLFYERHVKTGQISTLSDLSKLSRRDPRLRGIMDNERCWRVAIEISKELTRIKAENNLNSDFDALRFWAERADYTNWRNDPIGRIPGVGLITFQYLRLQAGVDTTMPDKIVKRAIERDFGLKAEDNIKFIKMMEELSMKIGYSQTLICWAIWLKKSGIQDSYWEALTTQ